MTHIEVAVYPQEHAEMEQVILQEETAEAKQVVELTHEWLGQVARSEVASSLLPATAAESLLHSLQNGEIILEVVTESGSLSCFAQRAFLAEGKYDARDEEDEGLMELEDDVLDVYLLTLQIPLTLKAVDFTKNQVHEVFHQLYQLHLSYKLDNGLSALLEGKKLRVF